MKMTVKKNFIIAALFVGTLFSSAGLMAGPKAGKGLIYRSTSLGISATLSLDTYCFHLLEKFNPLPIYILRGYAIEVDPRDYEVKLVASNDFETPLRLSSAMDANGAVAGINGGYYSFDNFAANLAGLSGVKPEGLFKIGDKILGDSLDPQTAIGWSKDGKAIFGEIDAESYLEVDGGREIPIRQDDRIPEESIGRVWVHDDKIVYYLPSGKPTPADVKGELYRLDPYYREDASWAVGKRVKRRFRLRSFESDISDQEWAQVDYAIRGNPFLVRNGQVADFKEWEVDAVWGYDLMPRTGLCIMDNGNLQLLATSDGTLLQFAEFAKSMGCKSAINLDGGPSTSMSFSGSTIMTQFHVLGFIPISGRAVHNHIVVVPRRGKS